jgi:succinate-semialdehyde dehydrogenase / glutarate-semialdehyde dehydrogenase
MTTNRVDQAARSRPPEPGVRIGGEQREPREVTLWPSRDTATGEVVAHVAGGGATDAAAALDAAASAFDAWRETSRPQRAAALRRIASGFREAAEGDLPLLISRETGKRVQEASGELNMSAHYFDLYARLAEDPTEHWWPGDGIRHFLRHRPAGIAALLTPWNFPASIPARKVAPALAAGCTAVLKPSEHVPLSSLRVAEIMDRELPRGVLSTVTGAGEAIANTWIADRRVRVMSFTGSTRVGRLLAARCAESLTPSVLELGGQAPLVVLEDADLDSVVDCFDVAKFRNNGQSCIAANRVWAPRSRFDDVANALARLVEGKAVGHPHDAGTELGPLALPDDPERIDVLLEDAAAHGAQVVRGHAPHPGGHYAAPAVCVAEGHEPRLMTTEVFGPVAGLTPYDDLGEVVAATAELPHGLAGYVCTRDQIRGVEVLGRLDVGIGGVNTGTPNNVAAPFGGREESGWGYEGGHRGLEAFLQPQLVAARASGT